MRRGSAVNNDRKRFSPVVPLPFFYLLMALNYFMELPLPEEELGAHMLAYPEGGQLSCSETLARSLAVTN